MIPRSAKLFLCAAAAAATAPLVLDLCLLSAEPLTGEVLRFCFLTSCSSPSDDGEDDKQADFEGLGGGA